MTDSITTGGSETVGFWYSVTTETNSGQFGTRAVTTADSVTLEKTVAADVRIEAGVASATNPEVTESVTDRTTVTTVELSANWNAYGFDVTTRRIVETAVIRDSQTDDQDPTHTETIGYEDELAWLDRDAEVGGYTKTDYKGHVQKDATTYTRTGDRESLTITNDSESYEATEQSGVNDAIPFLYWPGYQSGGSFAGSIPVTHFVAETRQTSHSEYGSRHTVAADGRAVGGNLSASSKSSWVYSYEADRDDPPLEDETSGERTTSDYWHSFGHQSQVIEEGGYYDESLDYGSWRRIS